MVDKSEHFVLALVVSNDSQEEEQRKTMGSLLADIETLYSDTWANWDGDTTIFEPSVFTILSKVPLRPVSLDYIARSREAGRPLPFQNRDVGAVVVAVKSAIEGSATVGALVRSLDIPREQILGCLQILERYGWIDFKVEINDDSHLRKIGEVDAETQKAYGEVVVKFVDLCDGTKPLDEVVKSLRVSLPAMKFVAQKLVLDAVLEVVA